MTKKQMQAEENAKVLEALEKAEALKASAFGMEFERLRNCNAYVYTIGGYEFLRSYNTIVAMIDPSGTLYDFLRYVYGYTATSAQQISKFADDYYHNERLTYREI